MSLGARPAGLSRCPGKKAADNSPAPPFSTTEGALLKSRWPARAESQKITIWGGGGDYKAAGVALVAQSLLRVLLAVEELKDFLFSPTYLPRAS